MSVLAIGRHPRIFHFNAVFDAQSRHIWRLILHNNDNTVLLL